MTALIILLEASLLFRPTFTSCSVSAGTELQSPSIQYRETGGKWIKGKDIKMNITGLKEDTEYQVKLLDGKKTVGSGTFRTWKSDVPVARTIEIDESGFKAPYVVDCKGSADGWIRITAKGGKLFNPSSKPTFIIKGAEYVLLDDMELRGAKDSHNVITIADSKAVRVRNCDIAGWGTSEFAPNYSLLPPDDKTGNGLGRYRKLNGKSINYQGAILIGKGSSEIVVERCYIHDPVCRSCSWYYCHPAGPEAIMMNFTDHSTVIRWCDFVGADGHNWNDAVEGAGNFKDNGGFNMDADVYGNFMIFANDDCIELDGGQKNVRCFGNRFESSLCGVSIQGCRVGPSLVYDNAFTGGGEQFGIIGATIKTSLRNGENAESFIYDNLLWGPGKMGLNFVNDLKISAWGNKFCGEQQLTGKEKSPQSSEEYNLFGENIKESSLPAEYPLRPLPFTLSRARISVGTSREDIVVDIKGDVPEGTRVLMPDAIDWLSARIEGNKLIVSFDDAKMHSRRQYRAALIARTPDGLSRPLSIYATTDFIPPVHAEKPGDTAVYSEPFSLSSQGNVTVAFKIEKAGRYWLMLHGRAKQFRRIYYPSFKLYKDGELLGKCIQQSYEYPTWSMVAPGQNPIGSMVYHFDLEPGIHNFTLESIDNKECLYDLMVLTTNPEPFEPNYIPSR